MTADADLNHLTEEVFEILHYKVLLTISSKSDCRHLRSGRGQLLADRGFHIDQSYKLAPSGKLEGAQEWFKASRGRSGISRPLGRFPQVLFLDQQRFSLQGRTCWVSVHSLRSLLTSAAEFWLKWVNPQWRKLKSVPLKKEKIGIKQIHKLYWWLELWNHRRKSEDAPSNGENS